MDIHFKYFRKKSYFKLLTKEELYDIPKRPLFEKSDVLNFLLNLGSHWFTFMTEKIHVPPQYLREYMTFDFDVAVDKELEMFAKNEELQLEKEIFKNNRNEDFLLLARRMTEQNPRKRAQVLCREKFK